MWWVMERMKPDRRSVIKLCFSVTCLVLLGLSVEGVDPQSTDCGSLEVRCLCGIPRCVNQKLVNDGVQDCQDGSDEPGQWDLGKCRDKTTNETSARARRGISELVRVTNGGATTTFFEGDRSRTRPVGLLTTTMGSFQVSGTTTEYVTKLLATYIRGTYARILTTTSRIYHALPTVSGSILDSIHPTGFIASTLSTEINGYATTVHTTDFYRTYIDNTYAQQISAYSNVYYPPWYTDRIQPSATPPFTSQDENGVYPTPVKEINQNFQTVAPETFRHQNNGQFDNVVINPPITRVINGNFRESSSKPVQVAEIGFVGDSNEHEVKVTGTHGNFIHRNPTGETTYNVFTGTYVQDSQTFLFFFGKTALNLSPTKALPGIEQQTILVENGPQRDRLVVDMRERLKLIVPGTKERTTIDTTIDGKPVEGVMVEIEGSEGTDELIRVEGATPTQQPTPSDPRIHTVTITMDKNIRKLVTKGKNGGSALRQQVYFNNEIPTGRAARLLERPPVQEQIQPTKASRKFILPTYTVGKYDGDAPRNYYEATTSSEEDNRNFEFESSTSSGSTFSSRRRPVFHRKQSNFGRNRSGALLVSRKPKTLSDLKGLGNHDTNDLMSAASEQQSTVTYVGFEDFTTTVGNTVIVFMPRTRMLEASNIQPTQSKGPRLDPTRFTYITTTEEELPVTTPRKVEPIDEIIKITTPKPSPPPRRPKFSFKNKKSSSSALAESTVLVSGRETVFDHVKSTPTKPSTRIISVIPQRSSLVPSLGPVPTSEIETSATTAIFQVNKVNPTGLVSSIDGSVVRDSTTTLFTSLIIGTYIEGSYAQVIKSTSTVFYLVPSSVPEPTPVFIQTTPVPSPSSVFPSSSISYEVTTSNPEDEETTTHFERAEVRVTSSTTEVITTTTEEEKETTTTTPKPTTQEPASPTPPEATSPEPTTPRETTPRETTPRETTPRETTPRETTPRETTPRETTPRETTPKETTPRETTPRETTPRETTPYSIFENEKRTSSFPIVPNKEELDEALNEIERARKVAGKPQDQIIVKDVKEDESTLEKPTEAPVEELETTEEEPVNEDQTIYVTKTVPTTVYRTYTYFTTYFIPKEDETVSSIISREVTSTAVGFVKKTFSSILPTSSRVPVIAPDAEFDSTSYEDEEEDPITLYKTYFTTFTYLTTFFTGETSSISSREEVISSVSTITQAPALPSIIQTTPTTTPEVSEVSTLDVETEETSETQLPSVIEQTILKTFFTTYTYFSTLFDGFEASTRSRIEIITNVVPTTIRSTVLPSSEAQIEPTATGRSVAPVPTATVEDMSQVESSLSENSESGSEQDPASDYYELESSEMTTDHSVYNELELEEDSAKEATPALKTLFTTFSFFTTYYKGGTSSIATRLETISNVISDAIDESAATEVLPVFPITYLTTFTYWTTHFKGSSQVVSSREETVSNIVTPGIDDINPTSTIAEVPTQIPEPIREPKEVELESPEEEELELTTYFTTYTYFTSSYIGDSTIVNSRLETVTNIVTGTPTVTTPSASIESQGRAVGGGDVPEQELIEDEHLPVGLLSTVTNLEVVGRTTTEYVTDVYGTYIDGIYAQVFESTSRIILPTSLAETKFIIDPTETPTGLLNVNEGKTIEGDGVATTFYRTETLGTVLDGKYAEIVSSSFSTVRDGAESDVIGEQKTGLVRVIDGSSVEGDKTTFYTSSIFGTIIENQYGQIIESTTRYVINPTSTASSPLVIPTEEVISTSDASVILSSSESDEIPTTTEQVVEDEEVEKEEVKEVEEKQQEEEEPVENESPKRLRIPFRGRQRSRLSYSTPSSRSFTPLITPFAARTRSSFTPRRKSASAVIVSPTTEVTPTVTATLAPTASRSPTSSRQNRFRRPGSQQSLSSASAFTPTPRLPSTPNRSRFQRPTIRRPESIAPTSTSALSTSASNRNSNSPSPRGSSSISPARASSSRGRLRPTNRFLLRSRGNFLPARASIARETQATVSPSSTLAPATTENVATEEAVTTEQPKPSTTRSRFGNNRFRVNPKLNVLHLLRSTTTTERPTTTPRPRRTFSRPVLRTRGRGTISTSTPEPETVEYEAENEEDLEETGSPSPVPTDATTTPKPSLKNLISRRRFTARGRPSAAPPQSRPVSRQLTTTSPPVVRATTRRTFAPRPRPRGFPARILRRPTTTAKAETEFDYDETRNSPDTLTGINEGASLETELIPNDSGLLVESFGVEQGQDLVHSGSEHFPSVSSPYDIYEVYYDDGGEVGTSSSFNHRVRRQVHSRIRRPQVLRTNFRPTSLTSKSNSRFLSSSDTSDEYGDDYYDDDDNIPSTTSRPKTSNSRALSRFRGRGSRISPSPTPSRPIRFTLTPTTSAPSRTFRPSFGSSLLNSRRSQSRYRRPESTSTQSPRTTSRFRSSNRYRGTTTPKPRTRFLSPFRNRAQSYEEPVYEMEAEKRLEILTVTHFVPSETTIPVTNGGSTEFKTILIPSPSVEVLSPYEYTYSQIDGQEVRVINSEVTSTPAIGFGGEVTKFIIKEVPTTSIGFTPTTIRGRRTSFSHVLSTHYYTVEPTVSTLNVSPLSTADPNSQLTNLLLSQLLGSLNLAGLQQPQQPLIQQPLIQQPLIQQQFMPGEIQSPVTQFNTKSTTYVTTITDYTSTIIPITLHGKAIKTTIVESEVNVLTATEFITESTVITPPPTLQPLTQQTTQPQGLNPGLLQGLNPALLQGLLQQQQQLNVQVQPTTVEQIEEPTVSLVTLYVSGKNPGEFSTVVSTVDGRRKRAVIEPSPPQWIQIETTREVKSGGEVELDDGYSYTERLPVTHFSQDSSQPIRTQTLDSASVPSGYSSVNAVFE